MKYRIVLGVTGAALACLLWWWTSPASAAKVIVYPPDGALLQEEEVEVTGYLPKGGGTDVLSVASTGPVIKKTISPGSFAVTVQLSPGVNTIILGAEIVRVFYAQGDVPEEASSYVEPDRHSVDNSCDDCHLPEWETPGLAEEGGELCLMCHDDVTKDGEGEPFGTIHAPAEEGECVECHAFHAGSITSLSSEQLMEVCFGCHDDFREGEDLSLHPPVEEGECLSCHDPHGSAHAALLIVPAEEVCFECHDNPGLDEEGEDWSTSHAALDDGCAVCHNPHASSHGSLLHSDAAALCGECHDDKNADEEGVAWGTPHPPVEEGDCVACHLPHGSAEGALLVQPAAVVCGECHEDMNADDEGNPWATSHPPVEEGECTACHLPHGSAESALLVNAVPGLCEECHEDMRVNEEGDKWRSIHPPVQEGNCGACHTPHGTTLPSLLVERAIELCQGCHTEVHERHQAMSASEGESEGESGSRAVRVRVPEDFPTTLDGRFYCIGCHRPHGSDVDFLWKDDMATFCTICHSV